MMMMMMFFMMMIMLMIMMMMMMMMKTMVRSVPDGSDNHPRHMPDPSYEILL